MTLPKGESYLPDHVLLGKSFDPTINPSTLGCWKYTNEKFPISPNIRNN